MQKMYVKFEDAEQVKSFVNVINKADANFELGLGRRIVDPKSILGVFALDLTQPQELRCDSDEWKLADEHRHFLFGDNRCCGRV